jgi:hypothetical protein
MDVSFEIYERKSSQCITFLNTLDPTHFLKYARRKSVAKGGVGAQAVIHFGMHGELFILKLLLRLSFLSYF